MGRILPILFNTEMVQAILDGRKTATRRLIKYSRPDVYAYACLHGMWHVGGEITPEMIEGYVRGRKIPYQPGDFLYARETWAFMPCIGCCGDYARPGSGIPCYDTQAVEYDDGDSIADGCFVYRADCKTPERVTWRPSIHMPKKAARIWLKVTDVKIQRLQDMTLDDFLQEGVVIRPEAFNDPENAYQQAKTAFIGIWDSTIHKEQKSLYGWDANPWVWAIEFKQCGKPEPCILKGMEPASEK